MMCFCPLILQKESKQLPLALRLHTLHVQTPGNMPRLRRLLQHHKLPLLQRRRACPISHHNPRVYQSRSNPRLD